MTLDVDRLIELAELCEKASGPDPMLDRAILRHAVKDAVWDIAPPYTASLDAALSLVPDGWSAWEMRSRVNRTRFVAEISRLDADKDEQIVTSHAATAPLALCAAAIRAMSAAEQKDASI